MSSLDDLGAWLESLVRDVAGELAKLDDARAQGPAYAQMVASPWVDISGFRDVVARDPDLSAIPLWLHLIEGLRDSFHSAVAAANPDLNTLQIVDAELDTALRWVFPLLHLVVHRHPDWTFSNIALEVIQLVDDRVADSASGFTASRYVKLARGVDQAVTDGQSGLLWGFLPALPILYGLSKLPRISDLVRAYELTLNGGWESPQLDRSYDKPETWRDTPTWMAQRTLSLTARRKPTFKLDRYAQGSQMPEPELGVGLTMVPIPAKRTQQYGVPAPDGIPIADAGGPAVWLQVDISDDQELTLDKNLKLKLRGVGGIGATIPLAGQHVGADASAGAEITATWTATKQPPRPTTSTGGSQGGASIDLDSAAVSFGYGGGITGGGDWEVSLKLTKLHVGLAPSGAVLGALVHRSLSLTTDLGIVLSNSGIAFQGANGLDLYVDTKLQLPFAISVNYLRFTWIDQPQNQQSQTGSAETDTRATTLGIQVTAGLSTSYFKVTLTLDGIGAKLVAQTNAPQGNLLGLGQLDGDLVTPSGIGLQVNAPGIAVGGGFFSHDAQLDRYAGAIQIGFGGTKQPAFTLRGVGFTQPRAPLPGQTDGDTTTLVLLTGEWGTWGLGAMLALHRGIDVDAIVAALPTGAIDALLFPQDPVGKATQIVNALATMFPAAPANADKHVLGVFGKYAWMGGLASIAGGILAEFSGSWLSWPKKLVIPASLRFGKAGRLKSVLWIEIDGVGSLDFATNTYEFQAVLRNSRFFGTDLVGGFTAFYGDPFDDANLDSERGLFLSLGGYHPSYYGGTGPQRAAVANRLGIIFNRGNAFQLEAKIYLAHTPGTWHFGLLGHVHVGAAGFELDGKLWFDALIRSTDDYIIDVGGSLSLILFSETICALEATGEWSKTRDEPHGMFTGEVKVTLLWWSKTFPCKQAISGEMTSDTPTADVHSLLAATLDEPASFPNATPSDVALANAERTGVWNAPEQPFAFVQRVAPLDTAIERMDATTFAAPVTLVRGPVVLGASPANATVASADFAPAAYLELDTDATLHAPVSELWPAGFVTEVACACGDSEEITSTLDEITVDRAQIIPPPRRPFPFPTALLGAWRAAASAPVSTRITVARPVFASDVARPPTTFAAAWARRGTALRRMEDA